MTTGPRETYAKIKGFDRFDEVCRNLKFFSEMAKIHLKYIFFPDTNDTEKDMDGFVRIVENVHPALVILATDMHDKRPLSEHTLTMMAGLSVALRDKGVPVRQSALMNPDVIARIQQKKAGL